MHSRPRTTWPWTHGVKGWVQHNTPGWWGKKHFHSNFTFLHWGLESHLHREVWNAILKKNWKFKSPTLWTFFTLQAEVNISVRKAGDTIGGQFSNKRLLKPSSAPCLTHTWACMKNRASVEWIRNWGPSRKRFNGPPEAKWSKKMKICSIHHIEVVMC